MRLGVRSYDIWIGPGAVEEIPRLLKARKAVTSKRAFIIADERLKQARFRLKRALKRGGWEIEEIAVPAGEGFKEFRSLLPVYARLLELKADRASVIFALGGGSIGDAAGFVASTYMRGIPWVGVPTTLLAQVDSSVGGKTAINHSAGKNLIGTTYQPALVVCDTDFLKTLSRREIISGLGEMLKYGIIFDPGFLSSLMKSWRRFLKGDSKALTESIRKALDWKCRIVSKDEQDRKGIREALNFGHTFGHALEAATRFSRFQHGEAIIWGMRFAIALSVVRGKLTSASRIETDRFLSSLPVPSIPRSLRPDSLFDLMKKDKKIQAGKVRFVLLSRIGKTVPDREVSRADLNAAFRLMQGAPDAR